MTICRQDNRLSFSLDDDFRYIVDSILDNQKELSDLKNKFAKLKSIQDEINALDEICDEDIEYIQSIVNEVDSLKLEGNDEEKLVTTRREQIELYKSYEALQKSIQIFDEKGIISQTISIAKYLNSSNSPKILELQQRIDSISQELKDIEESIKDIIDKSDSNEKIIEVIDAKLTQLRSIARKYKVQPNDLINFAESYRQKIDTALHLETKRKNLEKDMVTAQKDFDVVSDDLNKSREDICDNINKKIRTILDEIMMSDINAKVQLKQLDKCNEFGNVEIKLSVLCPSNKKKLLSGGEMSRLLLAIKIATAKLDIPIIFDEIDIGIGGATAYKIGGKLAELSSLGQIIVVTHQAQVAAHGNNHLLVQKEQGNSIIKMLSKTQRIEEIGRMISGSQTTKEPLLAARKLIEDCGADGGT